MYDKLPLKRYNSTLDFMKGAVAKDAKILDLGVNNPFSEMMREKGWDVSNTKGEDLDNDQSALKDDSYDLVTAFEILEHTLNPYEILKAVKAKHMFVSVPLKYWFSSAYRSNTDKWDRHYHEFEDWQFDWLLEKTGWEIVKSEKWISGGRWFGFRPVLRNFYNRYYILEVRKKAN